MTVTGEVHTTAAEILAAGGLGGDPPLIDVNTVADAHAIERLPWIKAASVTVSFPSSVRVTVTERRPVAALAIGSGRVALVDVTGRALADDPRRSEGIVLLTGLARPPAPGGRVRGAATLLVAAAALPRSLVGRIAALQAEPGLGVVAELRARCGGDPRINRRSAGEVRRARDGVLPRFRCTVLPRSTCADRLIRS